MTKFISAEAIGLAGKVIVVALKSRFRRGGGVGIFDAGDCANSVFGDGKIVSDAELLAYLSTDGYAPSDVGLADSPALPEEFPGAGTVGQEAGVELVNQALVFGASSVPVKSKLLTQFAVCINEVVVVCVDVGRKGHIFHRKHIPSGLDFISRLQRDGQGVANVLNTPVRSNASASISSFVN